ncbi:MAG: hypothetical protein M3R17_01275 [Bacteroidota bacterium]|nr:hypothetical protein [Bacteroidota bacterium]
MKAIKQTLFISAITLSGIMLGSCSNDNDQAAIEKRRADSMELVNKILQENQDQTNTNTNNTNTPTGDEGKSQLAAQLKVVNDDISTCDANITSGTVAIAINTEKKINKNLSQAERDAANEKLAAAVLLVRVNTEKKEQLEKQRDALQKQLEK